MILEMSFLYIFIWFCRAYKYRLCQVSSIVKSTSSTVKPPPPIKAADSMLLAMINHAINMMDIHCTDANIAHFILFFLAKHHKYIHHKPNITLVKSANIIESLCSGTFFAVFQFSSNCSSLYLAEFMGCYIRSYKSINNETTTHYPSWRTT